MHIVIFYLTLCTWLEVPRNMKKPVKLSLDLKAPILTSDILTDLSSARLITFPEDLSDYIWGHPASVIEAAAVISERNLYNRTQLT